MHINKLNELLATKIRLIRQQKGYSQENLAQLLGITQSSYSRIEQNAASLSIERLQQIAEHLEVDIQNLLNTENQVFNANDSTNRSAINSSSITINQFPKELMERIDNIELLLVQLTTQMK